MPISAQNRARYPADWSKISRGRKERAGWRCEGSPAFPDCRARHGWPHPRTGSRVVLTTAHLNHTPEDNRDENLRVWCQLCHLTYDRDEHNANARRTRRGRRALGDLFEDSAP